MITGTHEVLRKQGREEPGQALTLRRDIHSDPKRTTASYVEDIGRWQFTRGWVSRTHRVAFVDLASKQKMVQVCV